MQQPDILLVIAAIVFFPEQQASNETDDIAANQHALDLAYEKQALEKRQRELDKRAAENTLLEQKRIEAEKLRQEKLQQQALKRKQAEIIARQKQADAEAETRKAKQELQALKKKHLAQQQQKLIKEEAKKTSSSAPAQLVTQPPVTQPAEAKRTGLLSSWLGDADDNKTEYINDLFKAADNALETEHFTSARQNYEKILLTDPDNKRAKLGLIKIHQQTTERAASRNNEYMQDLLTAADNALASDRLSSANHNYEKVLQQVPGHEQATTGLDNVFNRYLQLAVEEAKDDDFDDAAEYFIAAKKLRPNDKKIKNVGREIEQLQNK